MKYLSLQDQISKVLKQLGLNKEQQALLTSMYINPGMKMSCLMSTIDINNIEFHIQDLYEKGLVLIHEEEDNKQFFPTPMSLLVQRCKRGLSKEDQSQAIETLRSIDKWIKYPIFTAKDTKMKSSRTKDTLMKWLFELHATDWEKVFCFGDYESFIETIGIEPEVEWIKERAKKGRKASVVATKDGQWAQRIESCQAQELRECLITPGNFGKVFIMAFPEIQTTVLGSADGDITFVQSQSVADQYSAMVRAQLGD